MSGRSRRRAAALAVVGAVLLLTGCFGGRGDRVPAATGEGDHVRSPTGGHVATLLAGPTRDGVATLVVVVSDDDGAEVFRSEDAYSTRHGVAAAWQSSGEVLWVLSSDIGTSRVEAPGGGWEQTFLTPETRDDVPPEIDALR